MASSRHLSGADISFEDLGSGTPVLFLHGFPATGHLWDEVAPRIAERGYRAIVPDLVGYGSSIAPPGTRLDMASQSRWMWELIEALGIKRVIVVAHDVGSAAAQLMVTESPARVLGLAVLDGVHAQEWAMDAIESIRAWRPSEAHRLHPVLQRRLGKSQLMREVLAAYEGAAGGLRLIQAARYLDPSQTERIGAALQATRVPARVLWGREDRYLPVDSVARPLAALLGAPLVLLPGGHFTPIDCPTEVVAALSDFLEEL